MIFNFWRPYPFLKPKKDGWYLCTVQHGRGINKPRVMDLYFSTINGKHWIDNRRQNVFDGYKIYKSGREPLEYNRVYTDCLCERIDVVAWKKIPGFYRFGRKQKDENYI